MSGEPLQRSLNKRKHLWSALVLCYCHLAVHFKAKYTLKSNFVVLGKSTQLLENVAVKVTLFGHLDNEPVGI